jgi:hypothetical protein
MGLAKWSAPGRGQAQFRPQQTALSFDHLVGAQQERSTIFTAT